MDQGVLVRCSASGVQRWQLMGEPGPLRELAGEPLLQCSICGWWGDVGWCGGVQVDQYVFPCHPPFALYPLSSSSLGDCAMRSIGKHIRSQLLCAVFVAWLTGLMSAWTGNIGIRRSTAPLSRRRPGCQPHHQRVVAGPPSPRDNASLGVA